MFPLLTPAIEYNIEMFNLVYLTKLFPLQFHVLRIDFSLSEKLQAFAL